VDAVQARHAALLEQACDRLVRGDHQILDEPVRLGLDARKYLADVSLLIEGDLRLVRVDDERAAALTLLPQRRRGGAGHAQGLAPRLARGLPAGEDAVHAAVVERNV
jgi:hypothetical protein